MILLAPGRQGAVMVDGDDKGFTNFRASKSYYGVLAY
jgi:hypothetical protein